MSRGRGPTGTRVLDAVKTKSPTEISIVEVAEQLGLTTDAVRFAVDKLERDGVVRTRRGTAWVPIYDDDTRPDYQPCLHGPEGESVRQGGHKTRKRCEHCAAGRTRFVVPQLTFGFAPDREVLPPRWWPRERIGSRPGLDGEPVVLYDEVADRRLRHAAATGTYGVHLVLTATRHRPVTSRLIKLVRTR